MKKVSCGEGSYGGNWGVGGREMEEGVRVEGGIMERGWVVGRVGAGWSDEGTKHYSRISSKNNHFRQKLIFGWYILLELLAICRPICATSPSVEGSSLCVPV